VLQTLNAKNSVALFFFKVHVKGHSAPMTTYSVLTSYQLFSQFKLLQSPCEKTFCTNDNIFCTFILSVIQSIQAIYHREAELSIVALLSSTGLQSVTYRTIEGALSPPIEASGFCSSWFGSVGSFLSLFQW
jgi:hypothetical protein